MSEEQQPQPQQVQEPEQQQQQQDAGNAGPDPAAMINALLLQMQNNFEQMSNTILGRSKYKNSQLIKILFNLS